MRDLATNEGRDDDALLAALAAGDRGAADLLVEHTYKTVFSYLRRLCGDSEQAADLTQETYRKAWAALSGFRGGAQFSTWLCRIAHNVYLNQMRRPRRWAPLQERQEESLPDPAPSADVTLGHAAEADVLRRAVLQLSDEQRFAVTAHYWGELPVREIARLQGVSGVAIRKRLARALLVLARTLGAAEP